MYAGSTLKFIRDRAKTMSIGRREGKSSHLRAYLAAKSRRKELPKTSAEIGCYRSSSMKDKSALMMSVAAIVVFVVVGGCGSSDTGACDTGHSDDASYRTRLVIFKSHEFKIKRTSLADL
ncbi:hypothetical protein V1477_007325, partial [Vespula maculifrons]